MFTPKSNTNSTINILNVTNSPRTLSTTTTRNENSPRAVSHDSNDIFQTLPFHLGDRNSADLSAIVDHDRSHKLQLILNKKKFGKDKIEKYLRFDHSFYQIFRITKCLQLLIIRNIIKVMQMK